MKDLWDIAVKFAAQVITMALDESADLSIEAQRTMVQLRTKMANLPHIDKWEQEYLDDAVPPK